MNGADFEFDVAFSFHSLDEGLATELSDLLQDRFKTFLYSKKQEILAGADGEEVFGAVFGQNSRCVVIFYRKEWGETPFTRIEQTAIRNRAFNEGYDFTLFIPTEKPPDVPSWVPRMRLWFGMERFGLRGAAAVIEARLQELGGEPRAESVSDRAARFQRARELDAAKRQFRESDFGVREARAAYQQLTSSLEDRCAKIASAHDGLRHLKITIIDEFRLLSGLGLFMSIRWRVQFNNSLDGSALIVETYDGVPRLPGLVSWDKPKKLYALEYDYALVGIDRHAYVQRTDKGRALTADELAEHLLRLYMDASERHKPR